MAQQVKNPLKFRRLRRCAFSPWGGGNGNSFRYSCLENPMERGAWQATVQGAVNVSLNNCIQCQWVIFTLLHFLCRIWHCRSLPLSSNLLFRDLTESIFYSFSSYLIGCSILGFSAGHGSVVKNLPLDAGTKGDTGAMPGSERSPGVATQSSILAWKIPWTRGAWRATIHWVTQSRTRLVTEHTLLDSDLRSLLFWPFYYLISSFPMMEIVATCCQI